MRYIPLLAVPLLLYNAFAFFILPDSEPSYEAAFRADFPTPVSLPSGAVFSLTIGAVIVLFALLLLGIEIVKAARIGAGSIVDHMLAVLLFVIFLVEFLLLPQAATTTFLLLMAIALLDLVCGFAVSLKSATRDVALDV
jgi:hypothetical protein